MGQTIQIKRSSGTDVPNSPLAEGELAYGHFGDSAGKLVIGRPLGSGDTATNDVVGGKFFVDTINAASSSNGTSTIVKRDANGSFAAGTITASLTGNVTGNATTATTLATARTIHGVSFDGSANIDLSEEIQDTVGAMFSSNTESGITATYQDGDGTIDLAVGTLNQDTTGNAATATALASDITINSNTVNGGSSITLDADDISEASSNPSNLYFTDTRAYTAIKAALNGATHSDVSVGFDDDNETIALTGTASVSAGTGVSVDSNEVSIGQAVATTDDVQFNKIGIGTAPSGYKLDVNGSIQANSFKFNNGINSYFTNGFEVGSTGGAGNFANANTFIKIMSDNQSGLTFETRDPSNNNDTLAQFNFGVDTTAFVLTGNHNVFSTDYDSCTLGIGGANVSDKQLKVHGDTEVLGNLRIEQSDSNTNVSLVFGYPADSSPSNIIFRNNTANDVFTIEDNSFPAITIPHQGNQTTENITFHRSVDISGDVSVSGTLTVTGTQTTITSTQLAVGDNVITLNDDHSDDTEADEDAGIEIKRGLVTDSDDERAKAELVFDADQLEWVVKVPNSADTVTQNASTPVLTVANINSKTFTIDGGSF